MSKEKQDERENIPPTPPIREKAEKKESCCSADAVVRAREELPATIDVKTPPSLDLLLAFAHIRCNFFDDDFTREWYRLMNDEYMWIHPDNGRPIRHWPAYFRLWRANNKYFEVLHDPRRIPDARKGRGRSPSAPISNRRADNWRGTREEDIGDVLG